MSNVFDRLAREPMPSIPEGTKMEIDFKTARTIERERLEFKADRVGNNGNVPDQSSSRITYLAHGKGYVMARHPGCTPFVINEALWRSFPLWVKP